MKCIQVCIFIYNPVISCKIPLSTIVPKYEKYILVAKSYIIVATAIDWKLTQFLSIK